MFVVRDGVVVTPPGSSGCLLGVTRALVLELARELGIEIARDRRLPVDALRDADEAFLTSTTREVQPIAAVDERALPSVPGPRHRDASPPPSPRSSPATSTPDAAEAGRGARHD